SWLPLFHDMGLIGCFLGALSGAIEQLLAPPEDFVRDPLTWLRVMTRHAATLMTAPNWGYSHCAQRVGPEQARTLDLSRVRVALNGAEMVDRGTTEAFATRFGVAGFPPGAMLPVYGLAEAGLAVAFPCLGRGVKSVRVRRHPLGEGVVESTRTTWRPSPPRCRASGHVRRWRWASLGTARRSSSSSPRHGRGSQSCAT